MGKKKQKGPARGVYRRWPLDLIQRICREYRTAKPGHKFKVLEKYKVGQSTVYYWSQTVLAKD